MSDHCLEAKSHTMTFKAERLTCEHELRSLKMRETSFGVSGITFKGKRSQIVYIWQISSGGHIWGLLNEHRETEAGRHQSAAAQALTKLAVVFQS